MYSREGLAGLLVLFVGCAGTNTGNPASPQPTFELLDENTFLIMDAAASNCTAQRVSDASKLSPSRESLATRLESTSAEFIVLMERDVGLDSYPLPSDRTNFSEENVLYRARAAEIARSQGCALDAVADYNGRYVHSYLLINAFLAKLTVEQAVAISELPDVRSVQLSESDEPPPSL